jgi:ubiquinone/menaquinone biosynthesis C-methylase UbiE
MSTTKRHDDALRHAFDGQAAQFERAPVQTDAAALARLVRFARLAPGSKILDAGCGPGLVAEAFLEAGCDVTGVDLSLQMIERARTRCARFGARARFVQASLHELESGRVFDAAVSRYVLHHVPDPVAFIGAQVARIRPGGNLILSDHTTDPDPARADWHRTMERLRDRTHTRNLTAGQILDLLAACGLTGIEAVEEPFVLDFDEWFDRGTPAGLKADVRAQIEAGPGARGFHPRAGEDGRLTLDCWRTLVRGTWPG